MATTDDACWSLRGQSIVGFTKRPHRLTPLPTDLHRMPGPGLIVAQRFDDSPVGPFRTFAIGEPARMGARPGYFFGIAVLDNPEARRAGRQYWGFPYELGRLVWERDGDEQMLTWNERDITVSAVAGRLRFPVMIGTRVLQHRLDGPVIVPSRLRALGRMARVTLTVGEADPLSEIAGEHRGICLDGLLIKRNPARKPLGRFSTLRAPLRAPEPGILGMNPAQPGINRKRVHSSSPRAYSSAG